MTQILLGQSYYLRFDPKLWDAMQPYSTGSVYVNYLSEEGEERVLAAYGAEHHARLAELKRAYDPENVFRSNQNIPPAGSPRQPTT